jgi:hypothetical protein
MSTTKLTERENFTKNTLCVGPVGPIDKENRVKMYKKMYKKLYKKLYKKYRLRYITGTSLKR